MLNKSSIFVLCLFFPFLLNGTSAHAKKMYRWVDDKGNVYFSDQVPPDQVQHKRETLNDNARVLDVVEKAKTAEELAQQKRLDALRREQAAIIAKQAASDKVLLATYRSVDDINRALENKLALLEGEKNALEGNLQRFEQQLLKQEQQAAQLERNAQKLPQKLLADIATTRKQIDQSNAELARHTLAKQVVEKEFRADIARFEFLVQDYLTDKSDQADASVDANSELGLFVCNDDSQCDKAWKIAAEYVYKFATTIRDVETDRLIMTADPYSDNDLSLSVSKLGQGINQQIFLDIRCKSSNIGKELCASLKVQTIRRSFVAYIQQQLSSQ